MRERQAAQMAAAFILRANRAIGKLRLMKLMYLAERESMRRFVFPIVCDDIFAMRMGMALSRTFNLMRGKPGTPTSGEWGQHIVRTNRGLDVQRGVSASTLGSLSRNDIDVIDEVWKAHGRQSEDELVHEVHHGLEEWVDQWSRQSRRSGAVRVPYETLFQTLRGMSESDAVEAAEEVAYFQAMGDASLKGAGAQSAS